MNTTLFNGPTNSPFLKGNVNVILTDPSWYDDNARCTMVLFKLKSDFKMWKLLSFIRLKKCYLLFILTRHVPDFFAEKPLLKNDTQLFRY